MKNPKIVERENLEPLFDALCEAEVSLQKAWYYASLFGLPKTKQELKAVINDLQRSKKILQGKK